MKELKSAYKVCRWFDNASGKEVAVKVVPKRLEYLAQQEIKALLEVKRFGVSRVANLLDHMEGSGGSTLLVLQYVAGRSFAADIATQDAEDFIPAAGLLRVSTCISIQSGEIVLLMLNTRC